MFLHGVGFSYVDFPTELQQFAFICADLNAHAPHCDPVARPTEREFSGEMSLDAESAFQKNGVPTIQDPSAGGFSTPDVTIVHDPLHKLCD